ncbi:3-carboxy-cis,cis-muconate cycloisomerase [Chryseobacterium rhizosphaerae]|uniref:3-carboxy-cis,cis-muconate cycloisomerase n=1 Tax=Chryseobacterium rhizosphaerae TaxID=395937 RepID=UPI002855F024|nr:3-carboxy-cis,cis-muconate cycloisomerase [Chryseobacterium rhizosphaerae]MDR6548158.1 3-carboxy-cis,cis-muconate cycloisomerase [Chryseobacterium rhizosphaerae]
MSLYSHLFYSTEIEELFADSRQIAFLLEAEAALALAQSKCGIIPEKEAKIIAECCKVELIDIEQLKLEIRLGANATIPLVKQLTRIVKNNDFEASKYVHFGATSQDIIDTATMLSIHHFTVWMDDTLLALKKVLFNLTKKYRNTLMIGRTLLQQAKPITFGLKTALWLESIRRIEQQLQSTKSHILRVQLAGAVGSRSKKLSEEVLQAFSRQLDLAYSVAWHTERDPIAFFASELGVLSGFLGKISKDISLLMQTEVGEAFEGKAEGKGGSSTMPHKRNPVTCAAILANTTRTPQLVATILSAMPQEHERSAGLWHAEWETLTDLCRLTAGSLEKTVELLMDLEIDTEQMKHNLELTKGLIFAENVSLLLTPRMGKKTAHKLVERACIIAVEENKHLKKVLEEQQINVEGLDACFDPRNSIGNSLEIIDRILENDNKL